VENFDSPYPGMKKREERRKKVAYTPDHTRPGTWGLCKGGKKERVITSSFHSSSIRAEGGMRKKGEGSSYPGPR